MSDGTFSTGDGAKHGRGYVTQELGVSRDRIRRPGPSLTGGFVWRRGGGCRLLAVGDVRIRLCWLGFVFPVDVVGWGSGIYGAFSRAWGISFIGMTWWCVRLASTIAVCDVRLSLSWVHAESEGNRKGADGGSEGV